MKKHTITFLMIFALCLISQYLYSNSGYEQIISQITNNPVDEKDKHGDFPVKQSDSTEPGLTTYLAGTTCTITPASTAICSGTSVTINYTTSNVWISPYPGTAQYSTNGGASWTNMTPNVTNSISYTPATTTSYCVRVLNNDGTVACGPSCTTITVYSISSSTPALSSPANYAYLYSSSVTFTWTHTTGTHPNSRYEIEIDGSGTWISTGTAKTYNTTVAAGTHTWRVRYYDGCSGFTYTSGSRTFYYYSTTTCGDVDHLGQNWTVAASTTLQGNHYNVGTFTVNAGVTVTVDATCHYFNVSATSISISGTINGNGSGEAGGSGGSGGAAAFNSADEYCWGGYGGGGGGAGFGTGGGGAGTSGTQGTCVEQICGNLLCIGNEDGHNGGGGSGGGGAGGSYGGSGGYGGVGAGGTGGGGSSGGTWGTGGSVGSTYGTSTGTDISYGSGGGGGGGGGGSWGAGGSGGNGGRGGGQVSLTSSGNVTISGNIYCNGTNGGAGGNGGGESTDGGNDCSSSGYNGCDFCPQESYDYAGGAGAGGSGGSGGGIKIQGCGTMNITGTLQANGGNGGAPGTPQPNNGSCFDYSLGGAGGGGGRIKIFRNPCETTTITAGISVSGGTGGTSPSGYNGNNGSAGTSNTSIDHPNYVPLTGGSIAGDSEVCVGGDPAAFTSTAAPTGGNCAATRTYRWMSCTSGCTSPPTNFTEISGATAATYNVPAGIAETTYYVRRVTSGSCVAYSNILTVTVVPDPVSPTATKSPDVAEVCAGQTLSLTNVIDNGGGTGTCNIQYRYSTNGGTSYSAWSTTPSSFAAVAGNTNIIQIRKNCTGSGCGYSVESSYSWSVVSDPATPTATKSPADATVCEGQTLTLTNVLDNGGGTGICNIEYCYSTNAGNTYSSWSTSLPSFAATGTDNRIKIRKNCNGIGCDISPENTYIWSVDATSVSGTASSNPASEICAGTTALLSLTGNTGNIQWQTNSSGTWQNIAGATNSTYTTPQLSKTTSYRAIVTSGVCSSVTSNVISVAVTIPSTSGIISNDYIWTGAINTAWDGSTNGNWIKFSGSDFEVPASVPTEASNVFIRSSGSCFTATPSVSTVNVAKCNKLTIDNGNSLNINSGGNLTVNGDFTNSGTVTMSSSSTLYAKGNWVNDGTFNAGSGAVVFNGSSNQEIQSGASLFNNVTFNNTATGVTDLNISESMIINGSAIFTNGVLYFTGTGSLSFTSNASSDIGTANSYVDGQVTKSGTGAFTFPVGEGIVWAPVGIAAPSNNSTITAEYNFTEGPYNWSAAYMCDESQLHHTSGVEHWVLTTTNSTPAVTLYWYSGSRSGITDLTDLAVAHYTGSCWEYKAGSLSGDLTSGTITSTISFSSYSPVSFGSKRGINPLPVELTSFDAKCTGTGVLLTWQTASESNNSKFTIERSEDGYNWTTAASVDGAGNSITLKNYYYTDKIVSDSILYYRLSQTDFDGVSKYSAVVSVFCKDAATEPGIFIYPNPFNNSLNIKVENWDSDVFIAEMYDVTGKKIGEWQEANAPVDFTKEINIKGLAPGMYTIKITTAEKIIVRKVEKE